MRRNDSWGTRKKPTGPLVKLFNEMRAQVIDYLRQHSAGRQAEIAAAVGLRRERISAYIHQDKGLSDVHTIQDLHNWMLKDRKINGT